MYIKTSIRHWLNPGNISENWFYNRIEERVRHELRLSHANLTLMDSITSPSQTSLHVTNDTNIPVKLLLGDILGCYESLEELDSQVPQSLSHSVEKFAHLAKPILRKPKDDKPEEEQQYQDQVHDVTKVTFTSIFHPFFLTFSIPLPLRGGKLPTKRPYCGIPRHYGLLSLPGQHGLHSLLGITKTMMTTMPTGLLTHAAIQYASLYSAAFCGWPY